VIQHVVFFCWRENLTLEQRSFAVSQLKSLASLSVVASFASGENIARSKFHFVVSMTFIDQTALDAFWRDPVHSKVITELKPLTADVAMADFYLPAQMH
jgi:hypothetical protein